MSRNHDYQCRVEFVVCVVCRVVRITGVCKHVAVDDAKIVVSLSEIIRRRLRQVSPRTCWASDDAVECMQITLLHPSTKENMIFRLYQLSSAPSTCTELSRDTHVHCNSSLAKELAEVRSNNRNFGILRAGSCIPAYMSIYRAYLGIWATKITLEVYKSIRQVYCISLIIINTYINDKCYIL